ncbi:hypothetical protein F4780DRAFT_774127 [Xylariomycetidae sp. FL0641]|nr:hypothetical protein F4780DRAFT_774127 [Xylariomycetidae sp. FL0641]
MWSILVVACLCVYAAAVAQAPKSEQTLTPWTFAPLPVGAITPAGWLRSELRSLADGFPGHMFSESAGGDGRKFYSYVRESSWLQDPAGLAHGASEYSALNEALPYWFNGAVPLAYALGDPALRAQVARAAAAVLGAQAPDGWLGPEDANGQPRSLWARYPFFLGLAQLADADPAWTARVVDALGRFMRLLHRMLEADGAGYLDCEPAETCMWGQIRAADLLITIQWLLEHHPSDDDGLLWDNMKMLHDLARYRWEDWYTAGVYQQVVADPSPQNPHFPFLHGVNVGQGLKAPAVIRRFTHNDTLLTTAARGANWTLTHHGSSSGSILGDEILRDGHPSMGGELCTAVETGYSLSYLYQATGRNAYADAAERVYLNAVPGSVSGGGWAHQYMGQPNQPAAQFAAGWDLFTTADSGRATVFGLEPFYPCCAVNFPQGLPKFLTHSWARTEQGVAHVLLAPSRVRATLADGEAEADVECATGYPFNHTLEYTVDAGAAFELQLRVPEWASLSETTISVNGGETAAVAPHAHSRMHAVSLPAGHSTLTYTIGTGGVRTETRSGGVSLYVGAVLYALDVGLDETSSLPHSYGSAVAEPGMDYLPFGDARDYYYGNSSAWAVAVDPGTATYRGDEGADRGDDAVFTYAGARTAVEVQGCEVAWPLLAGLTPGDVPSDPSCVGPRRMFTFRPYAALKAHMSVLPTVSFG